MDFNFKNKNVFITGGTKGIGFEILKLFLSLNANVITTGRSKEFFKEKIDYYKIDFSEKGWEIQLEEIIKNYKKIDILINNAGINKISSIDNLDSNKLNEIINVNLIAPMITTKFISKLMIENNFGRIVNISSIFGLVSKKGRASYSASKAGLIGMTKACALDLAKYSILVNSVSPGFTRTDLTENILGVEGMRKIEKQIPLERLAEVDEISNLVVFLSSNLNSYITGQNFVIDGGYLAK